MCPLYRISELDSFIAYEVRIRREYTGRFAGSVNIFGGDNIGRYE